MKIKMKTTASGPAGSFLSGWEYDLPEDVAITFVEGGYAEILEKPRAKTIEIETATAPGPEERAEVKPKPRARRKARSPKKG